ncbi:unnamed protein product, partial [Meganyctiphanes norvegica]
MSHVSPMRIYGHVRDFFQRGTPPKKGLENTSLLSSVSSARQNKTEAYAGEEFKKIMKCLSDMKFTAASQHWISENGSKSKGNSRDIVHLQQQNQTLQEENNMLKLKVEMLLDMLTEKSAEALIKEKEISKLKSRRKDG